MRNDASGANASRDATALRSRASMARGLIVIAILFALQATDGIDQVALSFTAPFMRQELGLGFEALGAAFTASYIGTASGAIIFGTLADHVGRKPALCFSAIGFAIGSLTTIWAKTGFELVIVRLLTGMALGGLLPVVSAIVLQTIAPGVRATAVTLVLVGTALGSALCGPLILMIEPRFGWRAIFVLGSIAPTILVILAILFVPTTVRPTAETQTDLARGRSASPFASVAALFQGDRRRITLTLWVVAVASAIPMFFTLSWLPSLAHEAHITRAPASIGPAIFSLAGLIVAIVVARIIDRAGPKVLVITTGLGSVAFLVLGYSFGSDRAFLMACGFAGGMSVSSMNLIGAIAGMLYRDKLRASGVGWAIAVMRLGAAVAPGLGGILIARGLPINIIFMAVAIFPLISAYALSRLRGSILTD